MQSISAYDAMIIYEIISKAVIYSLNKNNNNRKVHYIFLLYAIW